MNNEELLEQFKQLHEDGLRKITTKLDETRKELLGRNKLIEDELVNLRRENDDLKYRIANLEKYSMKSNVIISGIEVNDNESEEYLIDSTNKIAGKLGVKLEPYDYCAIHRLPSKDKSRPPPVIVKLNNRSKKKQLVRKSKEAKLKGIYVANHLTREMKWLKGKAIECRNDGLLKYVWDSDDGNILVREMENSRTISLTSVVDLEMLIAKIQGTEEPSSNQMENIAAMES